MEELLDHYKDGAFPFDVILPEETKKKIRALAPNIHALADAKAMYHRGKNQRVGDVILQGQNFGERFNIVKQADMRLFFGQCDGDFGSRPADNGKVSDLAAIKMMTRIAVQVFGRYYDSNQWHQITADTPRTALAHRRAGGYFEELIKGNRGSFSKVDIALLACAFRTPLKFWELDSTEMFEREVGRISEAHKATPSELFEYFAERAENNATLQIFDDQIAAADAGIEAAKTDADLAAGRYMGAIIDHHLERPIRAGRQIWNRMELPVGFTTAECLLFERDAQGDITLLSDHFSVNGDVYHEGVFQTPINPKACVRLGVPGRSQLFLIVARPPDTEADSLRNTNCFRNSAAWENGSGPAVTGEEIIDLRERLSRKTRDNWSVYRRNVQIEESVSSDS